MSVAEADRLRAAWAKIDTPEKWCKGISRSADGKQYCMSGAIDWTCQGNSNQQRIKDTLRSVLPYKFGGLITEANDSPNTTHADVARWFAEAIARAEAEG